MLISYIFERFNLRSIIIFYRFSQVVQSFSYIRLFTRLGNDIFCTVEQVPLCVCAFGMFYAKLVVAVGRSLAVFTPDFYQRHFTIRISILSMVLIGIWILAFMLTAFATNLIRFRTHGLLGNCIMESKKKWVSNMMRSLLYLIPCSASLAVYLLIFLRIFLAKNHDRRDRLKQRAHGSLPMVFTAVYLLSTFTPDVMHNPTTIEGLAKLIDIYLWLLFLVRFGYMIIPVSESLTLSFFVSYIIHYFKVEF